MRFNFGFFMREALKNIRTNFLMSITAATTTFICILVLGVGLLVSSHVEGIVGSVQQDVNIEWYLPSDMNQEEIDEMENRIGGFPEVANVSYTSEEQALTRFQETFSDNPEVYQDIGEGVLPASLEIQLNEASQADAVADRLESEGAAPGELNYPQQTIERLDAATGYMIWGLYGATALFLVSSVLLISNSIRLSIFARRNEIEVMKLVGASDGFVRTPFVFEGLLQSIVGATLAALVVVWLNLLFVDWSQSALPYMPVASGAVNTLFILFALIIVGAAIGVVGSFVSVTRFLRI
ncbi:MAG: ABC transporter permease [Actinomycetota bacterium]|jgi:cell division transport system permease protein|nr:ABC transporter permease [Rubrobacter sp.]MDQ3507427.1 ABC transporter permease [Actinomycetota bacterium]